MALTGVSITFGYPSRGNVATALPFAVDGSQEMTTPGTSMANPYPGVGMLSISASAPIFYATGHAPDATNGPRRYMDPSFGRQDILIDVGDKFAWIFA
jgi:hypothetical protein